MTSINDHFAHSTLTHTSHITQKQCCNDHFAHSTLTHTSHITQKQCCNAKFSQTQLGLRLYHLILTFSPYVHAASCKLYSEGYRPCTSCMLQVRQAGKSVRQEAMSQQPEMESCSHSTTSSADSNRLGSNIKAAVPSKPPAQGDFVACLELAQQGQFHQAFTL